MKGKKKHILTKTSKEEKEEKKKEEEEEENDQKRKQKDKDAEMKYDINFFIIREIPFNDPYNGNYEILEKHSKLTETYFLSDSSSSNEQKEMEKKENLIESEVEKQLKKKIKKEKTTTNEFLKQCEFSIDGSCYYSISNGNRLRFFFTDYSLINFWEHMHVKQNMNTEENKETNNNDLKEYVKRENVIAALPHLLETQKNMTESEIMNIDKGTIDKTLHGYIYDCKFYPYHDWNNLNTCFYAVASKNNPVYIFSTYSDTLLVSLKTLNKSFELTTCYSMCFHPARNSILCATNGCIQVFDLHNPREIGEKRILSTRKGKGQKGIISSISYKTEGLGQYEMYAIGDYNDCLYLYADNCDHKNDYVLKFKNENNEKQKEKGNGITHIKWYDEYTILSGSRNSSYIYLYDIRNSTTYVQKYYRLALTNQKYTFDINYDSLICGDTYGHIYIYNIKTGVLENKKLINRYSPIISIHKNPQYPFLLIGSGTRRYCTNDSCNIDMFAQVLLTENDNISCMQQENYCFPTVSKYMNSVCTVIMN